MGDFFDYVTGEILKCAFGELNNVTVPYKEEELDGHRVASIHNHPKEVLSPPSGKNFGILNRKLEDYELIVGNDCFWVLKAKGINKDLIIEFNVASALFYNSSKEYCSNRYDNSEIIDNVCELMYGNQLSKFINDKTLNNLTL